MDVQDIKRRLERAELFLFYLDGCWEALKGLSIHFNWVSTVQEIKKDIERIKNIIS